jgi:NAD(P)-dependent dehydrogenase (short-subunit alcohol dehydrogenase family)
MKPFDGKVAIITGAARGIGNAVAWRLGAMGAKVVINDIGTEFSVNNTNSDIVFNSVVELKKEGIDCIESSLDISVPSNCYRLAGLAHEKFGGIDYLIHCAAVRASGEWSEVSGMMIRNTFFTNVFSSIFLTNICASFMQKRGGGHIVLFGSGCINDGPPGTALYASSKSAIDTYSRVVAKELDKFKVKMNCIWPSAKTRLNPDSANPPHTIATFIGKLLLDNQPTGCVFSVDGSNISLILERAYAPIEE